MAPDTAKEIYEFLAPQLQQESETTRKLLAAVPDKSGYKPSERCMDGLTLASHIALSEVFFLRGALNGKFEWKPIEFKTPAEALAFYDENVSGLLAETAKLSGEQLAEPIEFATWKETRVWYLNMGMKHTIHHRGQLAAYLRPMGSKVPGIYGPTADDEPAKSASGDK